MARNQWRNQREVMGKYLSKRMYGMFGYVVALKKINKPSGNLNYKCKESDRRNGRTMSFVIRLGNGRSRWVRLGWVELGWVVLLQKAAENSNRRHVDSRVTLDVCILREFACFGQPRTNEGKTLFADVPDLAGESGRFR